MTIAEFVKEKRKKHHWTQKDLAFYGGVGLRFIRELEQGKTTLRMDKVNQILDMFSATLVPGPIDRSVYAESGSVPFLTAFLIPDFQSCAEFRQHRCADLWYNSNVFLWGLCALERESNEAKWLSSYIKAGGMRSRPSLTRRGRDVLHP